MTGVMLNYNCKTMAMAKRANRLSCELVRSLAHTAAPLKPFEAMPCATVWDKLRFISPRNETRRHKLMEELHRKHGKMFRLHFPGLKHKPICCLFVCCLFVCLLFVCLLFVVCCLLLVACCLLLACLLACFCFCFVLFCFVLFDCVFVFCFCFCFVFVFVFVFLSN